MITATEPNATEIRILEAVHRRERARIKDRIIDTLRLSNGEPLDTNEIVDRVCKLNPPSSTSKSDTTLFSKFKSDNPRLPSVYFRDWRKDVIYRMLRKMSEQGDVVRLPGRGDNNCSLWSLPVLDRLASAITEVCNACSNDYEGECGHYDN